REIGGYNRATRHHAPPHARGSQMKGYAIILLTIATALVSILAGLARQQVVAVTILGLAIYGTLLFWQFRLTFIFIGIVALLVFGVIDIEHLVEFANLEIILFLVGMMIIIGFLEKRHFFEYLISDILRLFGDSGTKLVVVQMVTAAVFASLVDEVTSILFMSAAMLHITEKYKLNPVPFIMMMVFATNIGSSATVVGNPIGVMIALKAELTFVDFLRWASPISIVTLIVTILVSLKIFSSDIKKLDESMKRTKGGIEKPRVGGRDLKMSWALFLGTLAFLVSHKYVENILGLETNVMLLGTALGGASIALLIEQDKARELVEKRVDWWTLLFFLLLFASVGALKFVGVTELVAEKLAATGGSDVQILILITWLTGILSAFLDNVLAVAIFIPIVQEMSTLGLNQFPLWWGLLFGGTLFGNLTMIGSTANIVAIGMLERRNLGHITLKEWIGPGIAVAVPTLAIATLMIYLQVPLMPG
ncbi:MAG: SLC13 family permease, partial [Candidatus Hydrothermarchaeaceae archaeon]